MKKLLMISTAVTMLSGFAYADGLTELGLDDPEVMAPPSVSGDWTGPYVGLSYGRTTVSRAWKETRTETIVTETEVPVYDTCVDVGGHSGGDKCFGNADNINLTFGPNLGVTDNWTKTGFYDKDKVFLVGETVTIVNPDGTTTQGTTNGEYDTGTLYRLETGKTKTEYNEEVIETVVDMSSKTKSNNVGAFVGYRKDWGRVVGGVELGKNGDITSLEAQAGFDLGKVLAYGFGGIGRLDGVDGSVYGLGTDLKVSEKLVVGVKYTVGEFGDTDTESTALRIALKF